jgi:hypothetical protein
MEVERIQQQGHVFYRVHSDYAKDSIAFEPGELMSLLHWLSEHENELIEDTISNRVNNEMKGM